MKYTTFLSDLHYSLTPANYVEIGIGSGGSFRLAKCPVIAVDPAFKIRHPVTAQAKLFRCTSDDFFYEYDLRAELYNQYVQLGFIDGMHLVENVIRDFRNLERHCAAASVLVIDDVKPRTAAEAARKRPRRRGAWTGDVWKIYYCLKEHRPDLKLRLINVTPTGVLLVTGLDRNSDVLWNRYDSLIEQFVSATQPETPPDEYPEQFLSPQDFLQSDDFKQIQLDFHRQFSK